MPSLIDDAIPEPYWLLQDGAPAPASPLAGVDTADLAVVGAGYSGLWTALLAKERDHMGVVRSLIEDKSPVLERVIEFLSRR